MPSMINGFVFIQNSSFGIFDKLNLHLVYAAIRRKKARQLLCILFEVQNL